MNKPVTPPAAEPPVERPTGGQKVMLIAASVALLAWLGFLAVMAFR